MRRPRWLLVALVGVILAASAALADGDLERNRRLLDKWRADPEHYTRLQRDLKAFYALPQERQKAMRRIDRKLHEGDLATQARLWTALDRYSTWLEKLHPETRQEVLEAQSAGERLQVIRRLREREWVARLPKRLRQEVRALPPEKWPARIAELRQEERQQRQRWRQPPRAMGEGPRPTRMSEFPPEVQAFVQEMLIPRLNATEREQLRKAEGKWPELARTILELSDRHPVLPPLPSGKITRFRELPPEVKRMPGGVKRREELQPLEGKWPDYALEVAHLLRKKVPLGASRLEEFPAEVQSAVQSQLYPILTKGQRDSLDRLQGRWPDYPYKLLDLARWKNVVLPGMSLPGPRQLWEGLRAALPDVPGHLLLQFALHDLSPEDRAGMDLSTANPVQSKETLRKAFFKKPPGRNQHLLLGNEP